MNQTGRGTHWKLWIRTLLGLPPALLLSPAGAQEGPPPAQRFVRGGGNLQHALNVARPGDTIVLEAGAVFVGPVTLPAKEGEGWITLVSSALDRLPVEGGRVGPADAEWMPKIVSPGLREPALRTAPGAHHYRLIGLEFAKVRSSALVDDLIVLGDGTAAQDTLEEVPHNLVIDRCYIHGAPESDLKRGIALNSAATVVCNSYISEIKRLGQEAQAICGWNGPGPYQIFNNTLEAAGENLMFGGADPSIPGLVPADISIYGNHLRKPLEWRGKWTVKNLLELKNARRVRIEANLLESNWADAQTGFAVVLTSVNQEGHAPWSVVEDVEFVRNVVRHSGGGLNLQGRNGTSENTKRIRIANNVFEDIDGARWGGAGVFLQITESDDVVVEQNTVSQSGNITNAYGVASRRFVFRGNSVRRGAWGIKGDGTAEGLNTLDVYFPDYLWQANAIAGANAAFYPRDTAFPPLPPGATAPPTPQAPTVAGPENPATNKPPTKNPVPKAAPPSRRARIIGR